MPSVHSLLLCFYLRQATHCHFVGNFLAVFTLTVRNMAPAAEDNTALPAQSIVERFFPQPELPYDAGNVALPACHLALAAERVLSGVLHEGAQSDKRLATTRDELAEMERASRWPRSDVPALPRHAGRSDSPAR
jgi:hypothetical protein